MKNKFFLPLIVAMLASCNKPTLYSTTIYNSPIFDENYYTIFDDSGIDKNLLPSEPTLVTPAYITNFEQYGYEHNMALTYPELKEGILSKLYDGRTRCDNKYQLSRVQINKSGFGTKLPVVIPSADVFEITLRGGSECSPGIEESNFKYNLYFDLVCEEKGTKTFKSFKISEAEIQTDNHANTTMIQFYFGGGKNRVPLTNISYYQIKFDCVDPRLPENVTDDYTDNEKDHLSLMIYEVSIRMIE